MLKLHVLASGSRGNAAVVENGLTGEGVLIDCGIRKRDFFDRATAVGFDVASLRGVLITHDHGDHVKGLGVVLRGLAKAGVRVPVYAHEAVMRASVSLREAVESVNASWHPLAAGESFALGGVTVRPFSTSHDAASSCGFRFDEREIGATEGRSSDSLGYMTDTGFVTDQAATTLIGVRLLALESNHDERMLQTGPYPFVVKQRIASDRGHLSNTQAADFLAEVAHENLRHVVAMHISQENNTYRMPRETLATALAQVDPALAERVCVSVAFQDRPVTVS